MAQRAARNPTRNPKRTTRTARLASSAPPAEDPNVIERFSLTPSANALRLLLRPEEAAKALGISRATCYKLLARGDLPSIVVGERLRRIPIAALNAYIATQSTLQGVSAGVSGVSA